MPRNMNPDELKTGSGRRVPEKGNTVLLGGSGMAGAGPNVGQTLWVDSVEGAKNLPGWARSRLLALSAHEASQGAHTAGSISFPGETVDGLGSTSVGGALVALHGVFPDEPPNIGEWRNASASVLSGITDWGTLKVEDRDLATRGQLSGIGAANPDQTYPYFYKAPAPLVAAPVLSDTPFTDHGGDPQTDPEWNSGLTSSDMYGVGTGEARVGAFTRDGSAVNQEVMRTTGLLQSYPLTDDVTGVALRREVTISGMVYPADRGVLALIHWPAGTSNNGAPDVGDFLAQDVQDRCVAALLLGQGVYGAGCVNPDGCTEPLCDGAPGGIFSVGQEATGHYDPFSFPGRATGQYDLSELHSGVNRLDGAALHAPYSGGVPVVREIFGEVPAPGQVRLGTSPDAGVPDPTGYGIPILGAGIAAYDSASPPGERINVNGGAGRTGHVVIGSSIVEMEDPSALGTHIGPNFFRYRLPYLKSYSSEGLKWTPHGDEYTTSREQWRYFERAVPSAGVGLLTSAGSYGSVFDEDNINWQIARYRHSFLLPNSAATDEAEDVGSYWLVHFKKEVDFEAFVRDGVMPWDATNGYEVFGVDTYDTVNHAEDDGNVVNEVLNTDAFRSPFGPSPGYGYVSQSYFPRRGTIHTSPAHDAFTASGTFDWSMTGSNESLMWVSGVAYWQPRQNSGGSAGDSGFVLTDLTISEGTTTFFGSDFAVYRTADHWVTGELSDPLPAQVDPAVVSSPSPAFLTFFPFAYGPHPAAPTDQLDGPSATFPLDPDTANGLSHYHTPRMPSRVEVPYTHLGPGGVTQYGEANGPQAGDAFSIGLGAGADIELHGDDDTPSFTVRARPRCFFRRPFNHQTASSSAEPYAVDDGHGIIVEPSDGAEILLHTSRFDDTNLVGRFSNQMQAGVVPLDGYPAQFTAEKDSSERFLDEQYRYSPTFSHDAGDPAGVSSVVGVGSAGLLHLLGPGMAGYAGGPIEVPVQAGLNNSISTNWAYASWTPMALNVFDLTTHGGVGRDLVGPGLQVVGWPDRNPPLSDRVNAPYPSTGLLVYPRRDYSEVGSPDIRPDFTTDGVTQPDYTGATGVREYVRCFDASFGGTVPAAGQPFVTIRLDGVTLSDIGYSAPGPGSLNRTSTHSTSAFASTHLAVLMKVPGMTTWMDVGRADGSGPSKQDNFSDGAGCLISGPNTFDGIDPDSGIVYCQIQCNVGPTVNLFASTGIEGTTVGEVPVLIKVQMLPTAIPYDMAHEWDDADGAFFGAVLGAGSSYANLRGLCGIHLVDPT